MTRIGSGRRMSRTAIVLFGMAMVLGILSPVTAMESDGPGTGTVVVSVKYFTYPGKAPLAGVEVSLWDGANTYYACTDAEGKAKFHDVPANVPLGASSERAGALFCDNIELLNPDNGLKMLSYTYAKHHGWIGYAETFQVSPGGKIKIHFNVKTPKGQNRICGSKLPTVIYGSSGDDSAFAPDTPDVMIGRGGMDTFYGNGGGDLICGGKVGDLLFGGDGNDVIWGEQGSDQIDAGPGGDTVFGGDGNDHIQGGDGNDALHGEAGNDTIDGGPGIDTCSGGEHYLNCEVILDT